MRILILGGYGFLGAEIARACIGAGHHVIGLGRNAAMGKRIVPDAEWIGDDLALLDAPEKWRNWLNGVDAVVNAAGALQDGARDDLAAVHHHSIAALVSAAEKSGVKRFVQISAPGARADASTAFMRTKAAGDAAVRASSLDWTLFKPGLVIGRGAYGGTALLRMLAGFPLMTPLVHAKSLVQTVALDDVAAAVVAALAGDIETRRDYDLVEDTPQTLRDIVRGMRRQLGFSPARFEPDLPAWIATPVGAVADIAGALGWRTALRSTALKVMGEEVLADPNPWKNAGGFRLKSFSQTIAAMPGTAQERLFARAQLALPIMVVALSLFWIASGVIALFRVDDASQIIGGGGAATFVVIGGALLDIAIGAGIAFRRTARMAASASVVVSLVYLALGTILAPHLWLDPLGAYVKIIPALVLGIAAALMLEER